MADVITESDLRLDPSRFGWPPTLPIEVALRSAPIATICTAYGLTREDWDALRQDRLFQAEVREAYETLKKEGVSFKVKARMQAEELLKTAWKLIHAPADNDVTVPAVVRADLIKFIIRAAGLDGSKDQAAAANANNSNFQINIIM